MNITSTFRPETVPIVTESDLPPYDTVGAIIFIVFVLLWYSLGVVFMMGMQIRARAETIEESARRRAKFLIQDLRDQTHTKEILEELVDKQNREKLWDIYLGGTSSDTKHKLTRAESIRIRNIEKQLAVIKRNRLVINDILIAPVRCIRVPRTRSDSPPTVPDNIRPRLRRRSSLDLQILEQWKALADETKTPEQLPWAIRKLMIRRHFRRHNKQPFIPHKRTSTIGASSSALPEQSEESNDEQCHPLLPSKDSNTLVRRRTEAHFDRLTSATIDDRQNPYLTYFHLPSNTDTIPNLISTNPYIFNSLDHLTIAMDDDKE